MYTPDFTKMFDPQTVSKTMQQFYDFNSALSSSKKGVDGIKKLNNIWADTYASCCEKQLKMCQTTMEDSIECMRELSTCKGVEEYMSKQAEWSRKFAEKCQTSAQDIAETMQKSQTQCTDIISKLVSTGTEWTSKTTGTSSTK